MILRDLNASAAVKKEPQQFQLLECSSVHLFDGPWNVFLQQTALSQIMSRGGAQQLRSKSFEETAA
jgi:hypothetical protein